MKVLSLIFTSSMLLFLVSCTTSLSSSNGTIREQTLTSKGYTAFRLNSYSGDTRYWSTLKVAKRPIRMLLDSGANSTDIDQKSANSIGLRQNTDFEVVSKGALGREIKSKLSVTELEYESQKINPFVIVINEGHSRGSVGKYDGQVGVDALVESAALIELSKKRIWMPKNDIRGHNSYPLLQKDPGLGFDAIPLHHFNKYSHLILKGSYNGKSVNWIVDTGAEVSVIDSGSARKLGLSVQKTGRKMVDISGDTSDLGLAYATGLRFQNTTIARVPLAVADLSNVKKSFKAKDGTIVDGILGVDFLESSQALLDPRSKIIYLGHAEFRGSNPQIGYAQN